MFRLQRRRGRDRDDTAARADRPPLSDAVHRLLRPLTALPLHRRTTQLPPRTTSALAPVHLLQGRTRYIVGRFSFSIHAVMLTCGMTLKRASRN